MSIDSVFGGAIVLIAGIISIRWIWFADDEVDDFHDHYL